MASYQAPEWCLYVTAGITSINHLILLPALIYYTYKLWKFRDNLFFKKRRPKLIVSYVSCIYYILFGIHMQTKLFLIGSYYLVIAL